VAIELSARESRAHLLVRGVLIAYGIVILSLIATQVVRNEYYVGLARENRQTTMRIDAPRGIIADRNGIALADNVHQARLTISKQRAHEGDASLEALIRLLGLDRDFILSRVADSGEPSRVTILRHADPKQIAVVEEHRAVLPDVQLEVEPRRRYHFGSLAAHLLGYVGEVNSADMRRDHRGFYEPGDIVGRTGVESLAENQLRGVHGRRVVEVNVAGHLVGEVPEGFSQAIPGVKIYLTLSQPLQARLEELLKGKRGAGVVIEVATGDILAMASSPTFDPNEFTGGISSERYGELRDDPGKPLFNRTLQGTYPPGSPYKLITAAAALEYGKVTPSTRFEPCTGGYRLGNRVFRCWKPGGHGSLNLKEAIAQSCDVYFYQLAEKLTLEELDETAHRFGLGRPTGVELSGEASGLVPDRKYYNQRFGVGHWTRAVLLNNGIGQGELLVTPLQMARTFAAIGGDGYLYRPHLILARENAYGVIDKRLVRRLNQKICSDKTRHFLQSALVDAVAAEEGTGGLARIQGVDVAGKTGTAENASGEDHAWFIAYAPAEDPEVAVAVIVENAGHGGSVAAPIVGDLLKTYFDWQDQEGQASSEQGVQP
jgi:penicillin-binding protein 2